MMMSPPGPTTKISRNIKLRVLSFPLLASLCGCAVFPFGAGLSPATPISDPIPKKVWLAKVEIPDHSKEKSREGLSFGEQWILTVPQPYEDLMNYSQRRAHVEESLSLSILEYLHEGRYFREVNLLPGSVGERDYVLKFQFDRYEERQSIHPLSIPLAYILDPLYSVLGGPLLVDDWDISGKLIVEDSHGLVLSEVNSQVKGKQTISLWSEDDGVIKARTSVIKDLLDKTVAKIRGMGQ